MTYRILCAYDESPSAEKAFDFAVTLARSLGAELHVLAVFQPPERERDSDPAARLASGQEQLRSGFEQLRSRASAAGVEAAFEVRVGYPAQQIIHHAEQLRVDHIVMGHRGKRALDRWSLGSVSQRVVSHATSAVTVVR